MLSENTRKLIVNLTFASDMSAARPVCDAHHNFERQLDRVRVVEKGEIIRW